MIYLVLLLVAALVIVWWLRSKRAVTPSEQRVRPAPTGEKSAYHAVSIKTTAHSCHQAKELSGVRYLSSAAPALPLPGCEVAECLCRFVHHPDRRGGDDRRSPFAPGGVAGGSGMFAKERRESSERRSDSDTES